MDKLAKIIRSLASIIVVIGALFKIQHWPGARIALTMGLSLMGLSFIITLIDYLKGDNETDSDILDS
jgi:hypothetical protein